MTAFARTLRPCSIPGSSPRGRAVSVDVYCRVEYRGDPGAERLSITGVEGPRANGDAWGGCGQIDERLAALPAGDVVLAPGWSREDWDRFLAVWDRWHLNDMRPACEHQRALGWTYDTHRDPETRYEGLPCPECGYRIGSAWLFEAVPDDVLDFLRGLPAADREAPGSWMDGSS